MNDPGKLKHFLLAFKLLVLAAILYWLWRNFPEEHWQVLTNQKKDWIFLAQGLVVTLTAVLVSFWRWMLLVRAVGVPMPLAEAVRLGFMGNLLNQISIGSVGGDLFKAIEAARRSNGMRTEVVASVLVDRAVGLLGLLLITATVLQTSSHSSRILDTIRWGSTILAAIGILGLLAIATVGRKLPTKQLLRLPWIGHQARRFVDACMIFQGRYRLLMEVVLSSVVVHTLLTFSCVLVSHALYDKTPTLRDHFTAIPPAIAAATLPITPGGLGLQEAAIDGLFKQIGKLPEGFSPLVMAIFFRGLLLATTLIGALYYLTGVGSRRKPVDPTV
jgi:glycosyltransferase 2 family protein